MKYASQLALKGLYKFRLSSFRLYRLIEFEKTFRALYINDPSYLRIIEELPGI